MKMEVWHFLIVTTVCNEPVTVFLETKLGNELANSGEQVCDKSGVLRPDLIQTADRPSRQKEDVKPVAGPGMMKGHQTLRLTDARNGQQEVHVC